MDWFSIFVGRILAGERYARATAEEWKRGFAFVAVIPFGVLYTTALIPLASNGSLVVIWALAVATGIVGLFLLVIFGRRLGSWIYLGVARRDILDFAPMKKSPDQHLSQLGPSIRVTLLERSAK
jgi:hypothetical protein